MDGIDIGFSILLALIVLMLVGTIGWKICITNEFNDTHTKEVTSVVVTIDELKTKKVLVGKVLTTRRYIVFEDNELCVNSNVYHSLEEGDKFVVKRIEWVNKETGSIDKIEYEVE